eukprot:SAG31_NODE_767_length_12232_cov_6.917827_12_plen_98_part_00
MRNDWALEGGSLSCPLGVGVYRYAELAAGSATAAGGGTRATTPGVLWLMVQFAATNKSLGDVTSIKPMFRRHRGGDVCRVLQEGGMCRLAIGTCINQ